MFDIEVPQKPKVRTTFMQAYVANMVEYLRLKHPEKTVDELNSLVTQYVRNHLAKLKENNRMAVAEGLNMEEAKAKYGMLYPTVHMVQATDPENPNPRKLSYGNLVDVKSMDLLKFTNTYRDKIITPFCSVYETSDKKVSFLCNKLVVYGKKRKAKKKLMLQAKKVGDVVKSTTYNNEQSTLKVNMNSSSGSAGCNGNFLSSPANYNAITSSCRFFVMNSYAHAERFLAGNFLFQTVNEVINHIVLCSLLGPDSGQVLSVCTGFGVHIPSVEEVTDFLFEKLYRYNKHTPEVNKEKIRTLVNNLDEGKRTFVFYMSNLNNLVKTNEAVFRPWLDDVLTDANVNYNQSCEVDEINNIDSDLVIVLSTVYNDRLPKNKKGNNISIYDCLNPQPEQGVPEAHPEIVREFVILGKHMEQCLLKVQPIFETFMKHEVPISRIPEHKYMYRDAVTLSDTDSIIFTTQGWTSWYIKAMKVTKVACDMCALIVFLLTKATNYLQFQVSKNLGMCGDNTLKMHMKNEFMMPVQICTGAKKNYASILKIQEGVIFDKAKLELKGVSLRGSTISASATNYTQWFIESVLNEINDTGTVDPHRRILDVLRFERLICDDLLKGNTSFLSVKSVKPEEEYADSDKSIYFNYKVWETVFSDKYGSIMLPAKTYVIPLAGFNSSQYINYLSAVEPDIAYRLKEILRVYNNKAINFLPICPMLTETPEILRRVIDIRNIVYNQVNPIYIVMKSLGINVGGNPSKMSKSPELFSDVYGWVTSEEAQQNATYIQ